MSSAAHTAAFTSQFQKRVSLLTGGYKDLTNILRTVDKAISTTRIYEKRQILETNHLRHLVDMHLINLNSHHDGNPGLVQPTNDCVWST